jgi:hypothetical protein
MGSTKDDLSRLERLFSHGMLAVQQCHNGEIPDCPENQVFFEDIGRVAEELMWLYLVSSDQLKEVKNGEFYIEARNEEWHKNAIRGIAMHDQRVSMVLPAAYNVAMMMSQKKWVGEGELNALGCAIKANVQALRAATGQGTPKLASEGGDTVLSS